MDALWKAMVWVSILGGAAWCQDAAAQNLTLENVNNWPVRDYRTVSPVPGSLLNLGGGGQPIGRSIFTTDSTAPATANGFKLFTGSLYGHGCSSHLSLLNVQCALPLHPSSNPFSYKLSKSADQYFPIRIGPLRYTFWSQTPGHDRPAGGALQNFVDGVMRHYANHPVMPLNDACVRSLTCNSLYERSVRRRSTSSMY